MFARFPSYILLPFFGFGTSIDVPNPKKTRRKPEGGKHRFKIRESNVVKPGVPTTAKQLNRINPGWKPGLINGIYKVSEGPWPDGQGNKAGGNRIIEIYHQLNQLRQQANEKLLNEEGIKKRKQRCHDVEPVFANIKNNHGFKRFMLRGKQKVTIETGLLAVAHNLRKKAFQNIKKPAYKSCRSLILKYRPYYSLLKN